MGWQIRLSGDCRIISTALTRPIVPSVLLRRIENQRMRFGRSVMDFMRQRLLLGLADDSNYVRLHRRSVCYVCLTRCLAQLPPSFLLPPHDDVFHFLNIPTHVCTYLLNDWPFKYTIKHPSFPHHSITVSITTTIHPSSWTIAPYRTIPYHTTLQSRCYP